MEDRFGCRVAATLLISLGALTGVVAAEAPTTRPADVPGAPMPDAVYRLFHDEITGYAFHDPKAWMPIRRRWKNRVA